MVDETAVQQPGPKLNREQRRAKARADRKAAVKAARLGKPVLNPEQASALLIETVTVNRWDAVNRVLTDLFKEDVGGGAMRLTGIGGATGVITKDALEAAAHKAIQSGVMLPQTGTDGQPPEEDTRTEEEKATDGGVLISPEVLAAAESIAAHKHPARGLHEPVEEMDEELRYDTEPAAPVDPDGPEEK